eukprot:1542887-Rhodomonas_salina.2
MPKDSITGIASGSQPPYRLRHPTLLPSLSVALLALSSLPPLPALFPVPLSPPHTILCFAASTHPPTLQGLSRLWTLHDRVAVAGCPFRQQVSCEAAKAVSPTTEYGDP